MITQSKNKYIDGDLHVSLRRAPMEQWARLENSLSRSLHTNKDKDLFYAILRVKVFIHSEPSYEIMRAGMVRANRSILISTANKISDEL